jgi:hypothetical protein
MAAIYAPHHMYRNLAMGGTNRNVEEEGFIQSKRRRRGHMWLLRLWVIRAAWRKCLRAAGRETDSNARRISALVLLDGRFTLLHRDMIIQCGGTLILASAQ